MKILILGAGGMLGHRLFIELNKHHEVWGTYRGDNIPPLPNQKRLHWMDRGERLPVYTMGVARPDVVINCIGAIPQRNPTIQEMIDTNASFPNDIALMCLGYHARLIHFSTDAVFSGKRGNYTEDDTPDGSDTYALTKRLGEISDQEHVLTLRCCPIGRELNSKHSLVEWFLAQTGTVKGYTEAYFNPLTTHEIAHILNEHILPNQHIGGLFHIGGDVWSKWEVLKVLNSAYRPHDPIEISQDDSVKCNRHLNTQRFQTVTGYRPRFLHQMIGEMAADNALYEGVHAH